MTSYVIDCTLHAGSRATIELPNDKVWADVTDWYVKWDTLFVQLGADTEYIEISMNSDTIDIVDWKRPAHVSVYETADDGEAFGEPVAELT